MILEGRGLTVRYPEGAGLALDGVDAAVRAGECVAVVGPNGGGKTTLLRALLGAVPLVGGEALVDGRPVRTIPKAELATIVAALPQREEPAFALSVLEFTLLGRYPHLGPFAPAGPEDRARVRDALERCDAWGLRARRTDTLSGGEWQRVRVARALAQAPRVLLLDEPTAALDIRHAMDLLEIVTGLVADGLGAVIVTHELNLAARYADRVLLLADGRVQAAGTPPQVLTVETLSRVFEWPVAVTLWNGGIPQVLPLRRGEVRAES
ncbi:MAG TPA: ABC transporter ATP-binding protein [Gemmatimonadales bacterium]|nr:ABC transporter ATP-binding protein [Gemmatimonadales bacterium]